MYYLTDWFIIYSMCAICLSKCCYTYLYIFFLNFYSPLLILLSLSHYLISYDWYISKLPLCAHCSKCSNKNVTAFFYLEQEHYFEHWSKVLYISWEVKHWEKKPQCIFKFKWSVSIKQNYVQMWINCGLSLSSSVSVVMALAFLKTDLLNYPF